MDSEQYAGQYDQQKVADKRSNRAKVRVADRRFEHGRALAAAHAALEVRIYALLYRYYAADVEHSDVQTGPVARLAR